MLAHGNLVAGQRLYEQELAEQMGISRTPIREAIRQLEREGLVTIRPNRETVVTDFTPQDVRDIYQFRAAIEGMAANLAAQTGEVGPRLAEILRQMLQALESGQLDGYFELDIAFHDAVVRATGNARFVEARLRVRDQTRRYLALPLDRLTPDGLRRNFAEHQAIGEAIRQGDGDLAEQHMRRHVTSNGEAIARDMAARPGGVGRAGGPAV